MTRCMWVGVEPTPLHAHAVATTQSTYAFGGAGKDILAPMGHITVEAHAHTKALERCVGWRSGQPERAAFVNEVGAKGFTTSKIVSGGFRLNCRDCDARPIAEWFKVGEGALHLGKTFVVGGCKEDGKVMSQGGRSFLQRVCIGVGGVSQGVSGAAQVTY